MNMMVLRFYHDVCVGLCEGFAGCPTQNPKHPKIKIVCKNLVNENENVAVTCVLLTMDRPRSCSEL